MTARSPIDWLFESKTTENATVEFSVVDPLIEDSIDAFLKRHIRELSTRANIKVAKKAKSSMKMELTQGLRNILGPIFDAHYTQYKEASIRSGVVEKNSAEDPRVNEVLLTSYLKAMSSGGAEKLLSKRDFLVSRTRSFLNDWEANNVRMFERLRADVGRLSNIQKIMLVSSSKKDTKITVTDVVCNLSDPHNKNQSVRLLEINGKLKVIYKPRSIRAENRFYSWLRELSSLGIDYGFYRPWVLEGADYGWMEYVQELSTTISDVSPSEMRLWLRQFGALTAIWYMLGGTDLHHENILLTAQGAVIVDCETMFEMDVHYRHLKDSTIIPTREVDAEVHTIFSTAAYSWPVKSPGFSKDSSGLVNIGGAQNIKKHFESGVLEKLGIETWEAAVDYIVEGVEGVFSCMTSDKEGVFLARTVAHFDDRIPLRVLTRETTFYGALIYNMVRNFPEVHSESSAKRYLVRKLSERYLSLSDPAESRFVTKIELNDLAQGDIPYIGWTLNDDRLRTHDNLTSCKLTKGTSFCSVKLRYGWLKSPTFLKNQIWIIKSLLVGSFAKKHHTALSQGVPSTDFRELLKTIVNPGDWDLRSKSDVQAFLKDLADHVVENLREFDTAHNSFIVRVTDVDHNCAYISANSYSLLYGASGQILFLGAYYLVTGDKEVKKCIAETMDYYLDFDRFGKTGKLKGDGLAYSHLMHLLYVADYLIANNIISADLTDLRTKAQLSLALHKKTPDLFGSIPGATLVNIALSQSSRPEVDEMVHDINNVGKQLLEDWGTLAVEKRFGLAHGALGVCLAASKLLPLVEDDKEEKRMKRLIRKLIEKERTIFSENAEYVESLTTLGGWCHGVGGRALSYYRAGVALGDDSLVEEAFEMVSEKRLPSFITSRLCCGSLGFMTAYMTIHQDAGSFEDARSRMKKFGETYSQAREGFLKNGYPEDLRSLSLFYGATGLGYMLLYCLSPKNVPPVWELS